jgi:hypothetical protein
MQSRGSSRRSPAFRPASVDLEARNAASGLGGLLGLVASVPISGVATPNPGTLDEEIGRELRPRSSRPTASPRPLGGTSTRPSPPAVAREVVLPRASAPIMTSTDADANTTGPRAATRPVFAATISAPPSGRAVPGTPSRASSSRGTSSGPSTTGAGVIRPMTLAPAPVPTTGQGRVSGRARGPSRTAPARVAPARGAGRDPGAGRGAGRGAPRPTFASSSPAGPTARMVRSTVSTRPSKGPRLPSSRG